MFNWGNLSQFSTLLFHISQFKKRYELSEQLNILTNSYLYLPSFSAAKNDDNRV